MLNKNKQSDNSGNLIVDSEEDKILQSLISVDSMFFRLLNDPENIDHFDLLLTEWDNEKSKLYDKLNSLS